MEISKTQTKFKLSSEELTQQFSSTFKLIDKLGEGSYGIVYKGVHITTNEIVAIKKISVGSNIKDIAKEICFMQQCDSKYIVKYYGSYYEKNDLWIILEYCAGGSAVDIMKALKRTLKEEEVGRIIFDVLRGLEYLHLRRKIHRDVKAGNILLYLDGTAKLADFGVSGQLTDTKAKRSTVVGSPYWMAPEVIQEIGYEFKADIWSLGITAIEMADGKPPFSDLHPMRAIFIIPNKPSPSFQDPSKYNKCFVDFVALCLQKQIQERGSSTQLLRHEFIKRYKLSKCVTTMVNSVYGSKSVPDISDSNSMLDKLNETTEFLDNFHFEDAATIYYTANLNCISDVKKQENGTFNINQNEIDNGTVVVHDIDENEEKPEFLKTYLAGKYASHNGAPKIEDEVLQDIPLDDKGTVDGNRLRNISLHELMERLENLEEKKKNDINLVKKHYADKRQPILDALAHKNEKL